MKRTTRNNILRYMVATVFVSAFMLIVSLLCAGLDWIVNKTGWPIYPVVFVICFIYVIYFIGKGITIKDKNEE